MVLEKPVAANERDMISLVREFDQYCRENDLECTYYRCDQTTIAAFQSIGKNSLIIGQEAIIDLESFTMEGSDKKSLRNAVKNVASKGFTKKIYTAPIADGVLQRLKAVSND